MIVHFARDIAIFHANIEHVISKTAELDQSEPMIIWCILDGKAGHEAQTKGLVNALSRRCAVKAYDIPSLNRLHAFCLWMVCGFSPGQGLPKPDLIVGAGHGTHFTILAAKRARGGETVVLMKPSLPSNLFDFCFIPEHDEPRQAANIFSTKGVLNTVVKATKQSADKGLLLIGGPSTHYGWNAQAINDAVRELVRSDPSMRWTLTTSRRTPKPSEESLLQLNEPNLEVIPFSQTEQGWVNARLNECATIWVTEESVSMVFEALTSGAGVGLLPVPLLTKKNRVTAGIDSLKEADLVCTYKVGKCSYRLSYAEGNSLAEADRCAEILLKSLSDC